MKKIIFLLICVALTGVLFAAGTERLVIIGFDPDRDSRNIANMLNNRDFKNLFAKDEHFILVMGKDVDSAKKSLGISSTNSSLSSSEASKIGEKLNASITVWGSINKIDNTNFRMSGIMLSQRSGDVNQFSLQISNDRNQREVALRDQFLTPLRNFFVGEVSKLFNMALQQFNSGVSGYDNAENQFLNIARIQPDNVDVYLYLGYIQINQKNNAKAIEYYNQGLAIEPNNESLLRNISEAYRRQGMLDDAIEALEKVAEINADVLVYYNIALLYRERNMLNEALHALSIGLMIDDKHDAIRGLYAEITYDNKMFEEAIPHFEVLVDLRPDDDDVARKLAICYQRTGQMDKAIAKYQSIIASDKNNVRAHQNLAATYRAIAMDNPNEASKYNRLALQSYQNAFKIEPNNARIEVSIADVYNSLNDLANAEKFANSAKQKQAKLFEASIILGDVAQKRGIETYNNYADLQNTTDRGNLFGKQLDETIAKRDKTRSDAHALFNRADRSFREALEATENDRIRSEINSRIQTNRQYIEQTKPDNF